MWHFIPNHTLTFGRVLAPPVPSRPILSHIVPSLPCDAPPFRTTRWCFSFCLRCCCDRLDFYRCVAVISTLGVGRMRTVSRRRKRCSRCFLTTADKLSTGSRASSTPPAGAGAPPNRRGYSLICSCFSARRPFRALRRKRCRGFSGDLLGNFASCGVVGPLCWHLTQRCCTHQHSTPHCHRRHASYAAHARVVLSIFMRSNAVTYIIVKTLVHCCCFATEFWAGGWETAW